MKRQTWTIIGASLAVIGAGVFALGLIGSEESVRQVWDIMDAPDAHRAGTYILIGTPQPPTTKSLDGEVANPNYRNHTTWVTPWLEDGIQYHATHTLEVRKVGDISTWNYQNQTRQAGQVDVLRNQTDAWQVTGPHTVFLIEGFASASGDVPYMWGVYRGIFNGEMEPKPSQFEGRVATTLEDHPLPSDVVVYEIEVYTAGCSSKFLPDDHQESS